MVVSISVRVDKGINNTKGRLNKGTKISTERY